MKKTHFGMMVCVVTLLLAGCASGDASNVVANGPGYLAGVWHGLTAPYAFIANLLGGSHNYSVYSVFNNGNWYDLGFLMGVTSSFSIANKGIGLGFIKFTR